MDKILGPGRLWACAFIRSDRTELTSPMVRPWISRGNKITVQSVDRLEPLVGLVGRFGPKTISPGLTVIKEHHRPAVRPNKRTVFQAVRPVRPGQTE